MDNSFTSLVKKLNAISDDAVANDKVFNESAVQENKPQEIMETASLLRTLDDIDKDKKIQEHNNKDENGNPIPHEEEILDEAEDLESSINQRFAQFLKTETDSGTDIETLKAAIGEGTAEYEFANRAFIKMQETIDTISNMVAEGGKLGNKIVEAGGDDSGLAEARVALDAAKQALAVAQQSALGGVVEDES